MTRDEILEYFKDVNHAYNDCTRYDTLKRMLDELQEPCTDAISRQATIDAIQTLIDNILHHFEVTLGVEKRRYNECLQIIRELPSVKPEPYKEDNNGKNNSN